MVGMRMADKDPFPPDLRFMRIKPKAQFWKENAPIKKANFEHRIKLRRALASVNSGDEARAAVGARLKR